MTQVPRGRQFRRAASPGFTLLELAVVLFIIGLMVTMVLPRSAGYRRAQLRNSARELAGRATYLFDRAESQKLVLRLIFDLDHDSYMVAKLDPYSMDPEFVPDTSNGAQQVVMPEGIIIRDVTVGDLGEFNTGLVATEFYPEGWVDTTLIHMADKSGEVMTLKLDSLTGRVAIGAGDLSLDQMAGL
ncbi:MAG TPA: prepilin-type N-terminal cleavage/methylation domain-containing protein [Candidatus Binataceae bacterium]|nr:prepilin-type N-terminal cleavage/methylation domain-containing protein [Candidatus Binataceae bacterium]